MTTLPTEQEIAQDHLAYYEKLYREMNPAGGPEVPAAVAAEFLRGSTLPIPVLSQIWDVADHRHVGSLDKRGSFVAFKLVAGVQQGQTVTSIDVRAPLGLPRFPAIPPSARASPALSNGPEWEITPLEQAKYETIFNSLGPINGKLNGDQVRPVLLNSQLSQVYLARIWEMADLDRDGMLDLHEMCIAMHLVYKCIETHSLPDRLPPSLVHPSRRGSAVPSLSGSRRTSAVNSPTPLVPRVPPPPVLQSSRAPSVTSLSRADAHSITSVHSESARSLPSGVKSIFDPSVTEFPVDKLQWEEDFIRLDTDHDGYVNGGDARIVLMATGLGQQQLAQIWTLVDVVKTGRLDLEQFALIMELIKEAKLGVKMPEILPAHLIPPSVRPCLPNMPLSAGEKANPRLKELSDEIDAIIAARRKADNDVAQFDADITVKSSAAKNLEIELNTLEATVKQLENQKAEANKRLDEMDTRIAAFEATVEETRKKVADEEERLAAAKADLGKVLANSSAEETALRTLRDELQTATATVYEKKMAVSKANDEISQTVAQLASMDVEVERNTKNLSVVEEKRAELLKTIEELERAVAAQDAKSPTGSEAPGTADLLAKHFEELSFNKDGVSGSVSKNSFAAAFDADPFSSADPFAQAGFDPFGSKAAAVATDAFGADPFSQADPFTSTTTKSTGAPNNFADFSNFSAFGQ